MSRRIFVVLGLALALTGWVMLAAREPGSAPVPMLGTLALTVGAYGAGMLLYRWTGLVATLVLAATAYAIYVGEAVFSGEPLADPLGYGNANGALYVQVAAVAGMAAARAANVAVRLTFLVISLGCAALPIVVGSAAAGVGGVLVAAATLVAFTPLAPLLSRAAPIAAGVALVVGALATIATADRYGDGLDTEALPEPQPAVVEALSDRRIELWRDAEMLAREHPVFGIGPGRFDVVSPMARADPDTRAAHSVLLEQGAETGLPGALLVLGLGLAVLSGLGRAGSGASLVALAAWTAFCLHSLVDYVANFPTVVALAALVAGLGTTWWRPEREA